jgi:hypothetical protein
MSEQRDPLWDQAEPETSMSPDKRYAIPTIGVIPLVVYDALYRPPSYKWYATLSVPTTGEPR